MSFSRSKPADLPPSILTNPLDTLSNLPFPFMHDGELYLVQLEAQTDIEDIRDSEMQPEHLRRLLLLHGDFTPRLGTS